MMTRMNTTVLSWIDDTASRAALLLRSRRLAAKGRRVDHVTSAHLILKDRRLAAAGYVITDSRASILWA